MMYNTYSVIQLVDVAAEGLRPMRERYSRYSRFS